jgi:hypothetical protein
LDPMNDLHHYRNIMWISWEYSIQVNSSTYHQNTIIEFKWNSTGYSQW